MFLIKRCIYSQYISALGELFLQCEKTLSLLPEKVLVLAQLSRDVYHLPHLTFLSQNYFGSECYSKLNIVDN